MTDVDTLTLHSIAESAQSAATRASLGDRDGAQAALMRAEERFERFQAGRPSHARVVRLAHEAIERARHAVEHTGTQTVTRRRALAEVRATERAVLRAKA